MSIKELVRKNDFLYRMSIHAKRQSAKFISDEAFITKLYEKTLGKKINLDNPKTFNEKIQWMKLNWRKDIMTSCADKVDVREYVKERIGDSVLNEVYGVYSNPEEIDLEKLPNSFVLKVSHGSGQNIICEDKNKLDWADSKKKLKSFLLSNHYYNTREWVYKNIPPRIICEKFLVDNGQPPNDYKIFCFNGEPKIIQIDVDKFSTHKRNMYDINSHKRNMYDLNWNILDFEFKFPNTEEVIDRPSQLEEMIEYAKKLSEGLPFVRVDFYQVEDAVIFGEMTFYPESGIGKFAPEEYDEKLGDHLKLPVNS